MPRPRRSAIGSLPPAPLELAPSQAIRDGGGVDAVLLGAAPPADAPVLWRTFRLLAGWIRAEREGAGMEVEADAALEESVLRHDFADRALWAPLAVIVAEMRTPSRADPRRLAEACMTLSDWALGSGGREAARIFAEAAAEAWPGNPRYAWVAGRLARSDGLFRDAEQWFRRAARVAVWNEDWLGQAMALNSLANLHVKTGDYAAARAVLVKAYRIATRHRLGPRRAEILHDLFVVAVMTRDYEHAEQYAARTFAAYGPAHAKLDRLAFDLAYLWMERGHFGRALPILRLLLAGAATPDFRAFTLILAARATGALDDADAARAYWLEAWEIFDSAQPLRSRSSAALELGKAAMNLAMWDHAREAFERARIEAEKEGEHDTLERSEAALRGVERRQPADPFLWPVPDPRSARPADILARKVARALQARKSIPPVPKENPIPAG